MKRIEKISSFIDDNSKVIDIGCDHGYLGIELVNQCRNISIISSDISKNALMSAKKNIEENNIFCIDLRVGNGLDVVNGDEIDTVVMAGLGSHTQMNILIDGKEKLKYVDNIILVPNDTAFYIRNNLDKIDYYIVDEDVVFENGKYYPILKLKKGHVKYSYDEILLGPILKNMKSDVIVGYYTELLNKKKTIYDKIPNQYVEKIKQLSYDIKLIEEKI